METCKILEQVSGYHVYTRPMQWPNESKPLPKNFNAYAINAQSSKSVILTLGQQQYLYNCKLE